MKISLINKVAIGFGVALLLLFIEGVASYRSIVRYIEISKIIEHTNICIGKLEEVLSSTKDSSIYYSSYLMTGDDRFLISYSSSVDTVNDAVNELKKIEHKNPVQIARIESLSPLIQTKIELQKKIITVRQDKGFESARDIINADRNIFTDGIQKVIQEMKDEEYKGLKDWDKLSKNAGKNAIYIILIGSIMAVIVIGTAIFIINSDFQGRLRAENAQREKENLLQKILETLPVGVFLLDRNGKIIKCNPACNQIWMGVREIGIEQFDEYKGWWFNTGERIKSHDWAAARAISKGETTLNEEIEIESFDGTHKIILNSAVPLRNEMQEIIGAIAINQDITGRKQIEADLMREKEFSEFLIKNLPGIFFMFDMTGKLIRWNRSSEKITGYSHEETQQMKALEFVAPEDKKTALEKITETISTGKSAADINLITKDGRKIIHNFTGVRLDVDKESYIMGLGIDISERKEMEAANKKLIYDFGERVKELTALHNTSVILMDIQKPIQDLLKEIVDILPAAWQYPDITVVRIRYNGIEVTSPDFAESDWSQRAEFTTSGGKKGAVEVFHLKKMPEEAEGTFLAEERTLLNSVTEMIKNYILRRQAENDLRDSRNLLQKVLETLPVGVWLLDKTGYIIQGNPAAHKIWEGARYVGIDEYGQYNAWRVDSGKKIESWEWAGARAITKGETSLNEEIEIENFKGVRKIILNSVVPIRNEQQEIVGAIVVNQDITELQKAKVATQAASRAKSEFLANMSHEIRTPMNSIIGMADLLSETSLTEEQKKYLDIFRRAGENLLSLINDILDLSKVEAGRLELEETDFDLSETIEKIIEMLGLRAQEKGLELSYYISQDVPQFLRGDPNRLRQILVNLIGNSVKFTNEGEVALKVDRQKAEGSAHDKDAVELLFSVRDTGIGIPSDKLDTIFESFSQAHSSTARIYGGTGLGLPIAKRLVEMMGGKIWVESRFGEGSTFYFTVKLRMSTKRARPKAPELDIKGMRVLVVDDSATNRFFLRETISRYGALATDVESGEKAISELKRAKSEVNPYMLLILDRQMPEMDGFQVVREIRKDKELAGTTVIMLTSDTGKEVMKRGKEMGGIEGYISKPIRRTELRNAIADAASKMKVTKKTVRKKEIAEKHKSLKILLVDDSEDNLLLIQSYLKKSPHKIDKAGNGEEAVARFKKEKYDLAFMDMQMPVMDGYTATREIRKWEIETGKNPTPIIALTAYALREDAEKSLEAGCTSHLSKPIKKADLLEAIDKYT